MTSPARPRGGSFRVLPERNLREEDSVANRVGLSQTEDRQPALACPLLQGRLIDSFTDPTTKITTPHVTVPAGGITTVPHKLGRKLRGWFICRNGGGASVGQIIPIELAGTDESFLVLGNPSATVLAFDLWVF